MAQTPPITIRVTEPTILAFLEWLRTRDQRQSEYLREWLETGFHVWLVKTAILDPHLYAEIIGASTDLAHAEELREQGIEALKDTLHTILVGMGGIQFSRGGSQTTEEESSDEDLTDDNSLMIFADLGDDLEAL